MTEVRKYLAEKADEGLLEYTIFSTGAFYEHCHRRAGLVDLRGRKFGWLMTGSIWSALRGVVSIGKGHCRRAEEAGGI